MRLHLILLVSMALACSGQASTNQLTGGSGNSNPSVAGGNAAGGIVNGIGGSSISNTSVDAGGNAGNGTGGIFSASGGSGTSQTRPSDAGSNPGGSVCVADAGLTAYQSAASGTFTGADLDGAICTGGVVAYMERTQASSYVGSQLLVMFTSALSGNSATDLQFAKPADATGGMFTIMAGVGSATPGTYSSSNGTSCGSLAFCIYLPLPAGVQCPDDAGACDSKYCAMQGSVMNPQCGPVTPEVCYETRAANSCLPDTQTALGSWTMNLTSVTPYVSDAGSGGMSYYVVHGTFVATMIEDQSAADAGVVTADLTMTF